MTKEQVAGFEQEMQEIAQDSEYIQITLKGEIVDQVSDKWEWCNEGLERVRKRSFSIEDFLSKEWNIKED